MSTSKRFLSQLLRQAPAVVDQLLSKAPRSVDRAVPRKVPTIDTISYAPTANGRPDPGEVVWGWVPFEENNGQGKDRPVLLLGRRADQWLALMLTSKDHDRDAADEARWGRRWMDIGTGGWDRQRRPSEVRLDRLLVLSEDSIRREGAAVDREIFDRVVAAAREAQQS